MKQVNSTDHQHRRTRKQPNRCHNRLLTVAPFDFCCLNSTSTSTTYQTRETSRKSLYLDRKFVFLEEPHYTMALHHAQQSANQLRIQQYMNECSTTYVNDFDVNVGAGHSLNKMSCCGGWMMRKMWNVLLRCGGWMMRKMWNVSSWFCWWSRYPPVCLRLVRYRYRSTGTCRRVTPGFLSILIFIL